MTCNHPYLVSSFGTPKVFHNHNTHNNPFQDPCVLSTLIELRADPGLVSRSGITAMWLALEPGHVQALLEGKVGPLGHGVGNGRELGMDVKIALTKCGVFVGRP